MVLILHRYFYPTYSLVWWPLSSNSLSPLLHNSDEAKANQTPSRPNGKANLIFQSHPEQPILWIFLHRAPKRVEKAILEITLILIYLPGPPQKVTRFTLRIPQLRFGAFLSLVRILLPLFPWKGMRMPWVGWMDGHCWAKRKDRRFRETCLFRECSNSSNGSLMLYMLFLEMEKRAKKVLNQRNSFVFKKKYFEKSKLLARIILLQAFLIFWLARNKPILWVGSSRMFSTLQSF